MGAWNRRGILLVTRMPEAGGGCGRDGRCFGTAEKHRAAAPAAGQRIMLQDPRKIYAYCTNFARAA